jgi:hypothetical protein
MLQIENETPFKAGIAVFPDPGGVDTLYLTVRGAFTLGQALTVADEQPPLRLADEHWGDPASTSLKYAGEIHLLKPSTDVVLVGHAYAMGGRPVPTVDVALAVGALRKAIRVFGDRAWKGAIDPHIGAPAPFDRMPLVYERAFGGILEMDPDTGALTRDPRNPVGVGFARLRRGGEISARKLPNLEDPAHLLASPSDRPPPTSFGYIAPSWEPRRLAAGTYDEHWKNNRAPFLPADFHPRFFNAAHPDLVCKGYLQGGEEVSALHVTPSPLLRFRIPVCRFDARVHIAVAVERPLLRLETVLIEPDDRRVSLIWRGSVRCDKSALRISRVGVAMAALELGGRAA